MHDVIVIGAGISGITAAIAAREGGADRVALVSNRPLGQGGCLPKVHGINAGFTDSEKELHYKETLNSGKGLCNERLAELLCDQVSARIYELESLGVRFAKDGERYDLGRYGGCVAPRALHSLDFTGREIANALGRRVIELGCDVMTSFELVSVVKTGEECTGALLLDARSGQLMALMGRTVVLACGGGLSTVSPSTNPTEKYLAGILAGAAAGATTIDLELTQFHPTGLWLGTPATSGEIIEEELRNQGAVLRNADGDPFMHKHSPKLEMATRDVVARAIANEVHSGLGIEDTHVALDLTTIDRSLLVRRFPFMIYRLKSVGFDLSSCEELPVYPASHFCLGGLAVDESCETTVPYLFACGEDAGGVHGANRLGGNGVAESLVFGRIAGRAAASRANRSMPKTGEAAIVPIVEPGNLPVDQIAPEIGSALGTLRSGRELTAALSLGSDVVNSFNFERNRDVSHLDGEYIQDQQGVEICMRIQGLNLLLSAALARVDSLGPHHRLDSEMQEDSDLARSGRTVTAFGEDGVPRTSWIDV